MALSTKKNSVRKTYFNHLIFYAFHLSYFSILHASPAAKNVHKANLWLYVFKSVLIHDWTIIYDL